MLRLMVECIWRRDWAFCRRRLRCIIVLNEKTFVHYYTKIYNIWVIHFLYIIYVPFSYIYYARVSVLYYTYTFSWLKRIDFLIRRCMLINTLLSDIIVKHYHTIYYWNYFWDNLRFFFETFKLRKKVTHHRKAKKASVNID